MSPNRYSIRDIANATISVTILCLVAIMVTGLPQVDSLAESVTIPQITVVREFVQTFLSWPTVGLVSVFIFKSPITSLIYGIERLKAGQWEAAVSQQRTSESEDEVSKEIKEKSEDSTSTDPIVKELKDQLAEVTEKNQLLEEGRRSDDNLLNYAIQRAELFELKYLDLFLVRNSKAALRWVSAGPVDLFDFDYKFVLPDKMPDELNQKDIIAKTLIKLGLVEKRARKLLITQKGTRFIKYMDTQVPASISA